MAATGQEMAYRCEQCGSPRSSPVQLYEQGLAASLDASLGRQPVLFARAAALLSRSDISALYLVGTSCRIFAMWTYVGFSALFIHPRLWCLKSSWQ